MARNLVHSTFANIKLKLFWLEYKHYWNSLKQQEKIKTIQLHK